MENRYQVQQKKNNEYLILIENSNDLIAKVILFSLVDEENLFYVLSLGSIWKSNPDIIDFETLTENGDVFKVLNSVAWSIDDFLTKNLSAKVIFEGNSSKKNRVYLKLVSRKLNLVKDKYRVFGLTNGEVFPFEPNFDYEAIVVSKKL